MAYIYPLKNKKGVPCGKWKYRFVDWTGKKVKGTGTNSRKDTQKLADEAESYHRAVKNGHLPADAIARRDSVPIDEIIEKYLNWGKTQGGRDGHPWNKDHLTHQTTDISFWKSHFNLKYTHDLYNRLADVDSAVQFVKSQGNSGKTINRKISCLKSFCNWMVDRNYLTQHPFRKVKNLAEVPTYVRRPMRIAEFVRFLNNCTAEEKITFGVLGCYGTRKGETKQALVSNYNKEKQFITLPPSITKNRKEAVLYLTKDLCDALDVMVASKKPEDPLLDIQSHPDRVFYRILKKAGIPKDTEDGRLTLHSLRTTALNFMLDTGANLKELQDLARHSNIQTTMKHYARSSKDKLAEYQRAIWDGVFSKVDEVPNETLEPDLECDGSPKPLKTLAETDV